MDRKEETGDEEFVTEEHTSPDEIELTEEEASYDDKIKALRKKLKQCEEEKSAYLQDMQRAKADFLNAKKRQSDALLKSQEDSINDLVSSLLPLCDSFEMAMSNTDMWERVDATWRTGIEGIYTQLHGILKSYDVTVIDPRNEAFDPEYHEAISTQDSDTHDTETVVQVIQKGYARNGTVIRPAKVILST